MRPPTPTTIFLGAVPGVEVRRERVAGRRLDRLLRAEDVPAEGLVGVEQTVVDVPDVALRRVEVDVHLLEDHALLLLDLGAVEAGVEQHVREHVEGDVARLGPAPDVVARQLLAGEGVELTSDRVDLGGDRPRRRAPLRPLKNMCSTKCAMPLDSGVSYREPAPTVTKHDTDAICGIVAVTRRMPLPSVCFSKTGIGFDGIDRTPCPVS